MEKHKYTRLLIHINKHCNFVLTLNIEVILTAPSEADNGHVYGCV